MYLNIIGKGSRHKCKAKPIKYLKENKGGCHMAFGNMNPSSVDTE